MVQAGIGGLDTPRTTVDATYLSQQLDFDISQEQSFQSPSKDNNNLITQIQNNGRRGALNLKTPRSRAALKDRRNLPAGLGGGEFTPLLKSATRNSALRNGKENVARTPAFLRPGGLDNIQEDLTPLPAGSSVYGDSRNGSYMTGTPMPRVESSSAASTPLAMRPRRNEGPGVLQDGNQLSLREQENVIDKIEKENFGLKLKIHFLEEALRKAGPGFSEAALKENTELKVDKVTMQRELMKCKKTLTASEREVDIYRQQFMEMQDKVKEKYADAGHREELERLRRLLDDKEAENDLLKKQSNHAEELQDRIHDLEADLREKDRIVDDREDEIENLKDDLEKRDNTISELEDTIKQARRRAVELEEKAQVSEELEDAKETIQQLEQDLRRVKEELEDAKEEQGEAQREKERAETDLEELQEELANKSITTKGLSRQIEEKMNRLQDDLEELREKHTALEEDYADKERTIRKLSSKIEDLKRDNEVELQKMSDKVEIAKNDKDSFLRERQLVSDRLERTQKELAKRSEEKDNAVRDQEALFERINTAQKDLQQMADEKNLLQIRHDALTSESASLQRDLTRTQKVVEDLEDKLNHEKTLALDNERQVRDEYAGEIGRLNDEIEDLRADMSEKERLANDLEDKWDSERRNLESQRDRAEQKASGLQKAIDRLQEVEGNLSNKESKLQQAIESETERHREQESILTRQIDELNNDLQSKRKSLEEVRSELTTIREELRLSHREQKSLAEKVEGLEDEVEILQNSLDDESEQANQDIAAAKQESDDLRRQIYTFKQDLRRVESELASARSEIDAFQGDLKAGEGSKQQLASRLRDVEAQLARVRQDKQALQDQLASLNIDVHSLRASKADLEAERDELKDRIKIINQQEDDTFRFDQERVELRTAKMKLDGEVRRLREENKSAIAQQEALEEELQQEIDRATAEETRLNTEIHDLQKILRGSSEKKELAAAKKTIQQLEVRIHELESQIISGETHHDAANEISLIRQDLSAARQKETDYLKRESAQKDTIRGLKRQITDLERRAHDLEISRFMPSSPPSSMGGSARKSEIMEVRNQLSTANQSLKELRSQLREVEKEAARKVTAANIDLQARTIAWETEKDNLERAVEEAQSAKQELESKNTVAEAALARYRNKIDRLERALQAERLNSGEDRTMVLERRDLHEMLRETQLQAESLEIAVQERDHKIAAITSTETQLRTVLKRIREERTQHRSNAASLQDQVENLEQKYKHAKDQYRSKTSDLKSQVDALERTYNQAKEEWATERKTLTKGVRFANMSLSVNEDDIVAQKQAIEERERLIEEKEKKHIKELRGMAMQLQWLRARCHREEEFRHALAYSKAYMALQISLFEAWYVYSLLVFHANIS
jgi:chromosome segregation ATPase